MTYNSLTINQKINAKGNVRKRDGRFSYYYTSPLMRRVLNRPAGLFSPLDPEYLIHFNNKEPKCR